MMQAGARVVAEYDVPEQVWYLDENGCRRMPFAVLLEAVLQPCGWLASYVGSALTIDGELGFRNLAAGAGRMLSWGRFVLFAPGRTRAALSPRRRPPAPETIPAGVGDRAPAGRAQGLRTPRRVPLAGPARRPGRPADHTYASRTAGARE
ncbi:MAG: hypothetical protein IPH76_00545 [Xanthomonadales bacterium]|nr:hypothetical protein [Xanthomonadales bacterium]